MTRLDPPRPLQLRFKGDWGGVNLTRICGWLAGEVASRSDPRTRSVIHTGRGMADNLFALGRGEVDVSVATPAAFARMARAGLGPFASEPLPTLRAIGVIPHDDALLFAIRSDLGIRTMADLRERRPALRIALAPDDGESFMGFGAAQLLRASGIELEQLVEWGGQLIEREQPQEAVAALAAGDADAVIQEAIMTSWWGDLAETVELSFLPLEPDAAMRLADEFSITTKTVAVGHLRGITEPVEAIDFDGWLVAVREDMRDDVASMLAAILVESAGFFEAQYRHIPVRFSPLTYPITAEALAAAPIPLHPGALDYYRSIGAAAESPVRQP